MIYIDSSDIPVMIPRNGGISAEVPSRIHFTKNAKKRQELVLQDAKEMGDIEREQEMRRQRINLAKESNERRVGTGANYKRMQ